MLFIPLSISPFPIDKGQSFSKIPLTVPTIELTAWHLELNGLTKNREIANQDGAILMDIMTRVLAVRTITLFIQTT
jgi:hypothetical protein